MNRARPTDEGPTGLRPAGGNLPPDPPPPYHDQFENTFLRIAKNRPDFFSANLTHARVVHPRGRRPKKKGYFLGYFFRYTAKCAPRTASSYT